MRTIQDLRKDEEKLRALKVRSNIIFYLFLVLFIVGLFKIFQLTILDRVDYEAESDKNRIITIPIYPSRGLIKLSDGTIVAENIVTHGIYIKDKLFDSAKDQIELLFKDVLNEDRNLNELKMGSNLGSNIWLAESLTEKELARYEFFKNDLPSIELETKLVRYLPHQNLFSHAVGHLGKVNPQERLFLSKKEYPNGSFIGKVGI